MNFTNPTHSDCIIFTNVINLVYPKTRQSKFFDCKVTQYIPYTQAYTNKIKATLSKTDNVVSFSFKYKYKVLTLTQKNYLAILLSLHRIHTDKSLYSA